MEQGARTPTLDPNLSYAPPLALAQEYIQELIRADPSDVERICGRPSSVHPDVWVYEHIRQFVLQLNLLVCELKGVCDKKTCPKMMAGECEFLSACYGKRAEPRTVSAIDYACHNIDFHLAILNKSKHFPRPSQKKLGEKAVKEIKDVAKRLYRIIAHAYFHHRAQFDAFEKQTCLYRRFALLCKQNKLVRRFTPKIPEATA